MKYIIKMSLMLTFILHYIIFYGVNEVQCNNYEACVENLINNFSNSTNPLIGRLITSFFWPNKTNLLPPFNASKDEIINFFRNPRTQYFQMYAYYLAQNVILHNLKPSIFCRFFYYDYNNTLRICNETGLLLKENNRNVWKPVIINLKWENDAYLDLYYGTSFEDGLYNLRRNCMIALYNIGITDDTPKFKIFMMFFHRNYNNPQCYIVSAPITDQFMAHVFFGIHLKRETQFQSSWCTNPVICDGELRDINENDNENIENEDEDE